MTGPATPTAADRADAARDRRDWESAARLYAAALAEDGRRSDLWVQYGHALKESGNLSGALAAYETALAGDPDVSDTHLQFGHALKMSGNREAASVAYARAALLDPTDADPVAELQDLVRHGLVLDATIADAVLARSSWRRRRGARSPSAPVSTGAALTWMGENATEITPAAGDRKAGTPPPLETARPRTARPAMVFDCSDLIAYFHSARLPTGIQRVQIEVIAALLRDPPADARSLVCAFVEDRDDWIAIPPDLFLELAVQALDGSALDDAAWLDVRSDLHLEMGLGPAFSFPDGAWLINLGTSWWLQNYFLRLRNIRRRHGVRYIPFVHDMIPVLAPEHCTPALTRDFISWVIGVTAHADGFLTNSEASRRDLLAVATRLGQVIDPADVHVVRLDADFRKSGSPRPGRSVLSQLELAPDGYVLFVSTVESRKNHIDALRAWRSLIDRRGAEAVPILVCVGARGWLNDAVFALLASDPVLRSRVTMATDVSDLDLADLYRACAFTLYPSLYEGWGLPVTEALCHGKAVLASDASSLPEAGGELASYFRSGDLNDLLAQLERMMFESGFRQSRADRIVREFRPRSWRALGQDMIDCVVSWSERPGGREPAAPMPVPLVVRGRAYPMGRLTTTAINDSLMSAEIFRVDDGWAAPETWGCRTIGAGGTLACRVPGPRDDLRLVLGLRGAARRDSTYAITVGAECIADGQLAHDQMVWREVKLSSDVLIDGMVHIHIGEPDGPNTRIGERSGRDVSIGVIGFMIDAASDTRAVADIAADVETIIRPAL